MKGMAFTHFLDMVGNQFGIDTVDTIIDDSDLASAVLTLHDGSVEFTIRYE
jgi:hypothetical protein